MRPEAVIQSRIQGALKACGYMSIHIPNRGSYNPFTKRYNIVTDPWFVPGVPDLVVLLPDAKVLWVEVKTPTGKRTPAQERMAALLEHKGHYYVLARGVEEVMIWLKAAGYKYAEARLPPPNQGAWASPRSSDTTGPGEHGAGGQDLRTQAGLWGPPKAGDGEKQSGRLPIGWIGCALSETELTLWCARWRSRLFGTASTDPKHGRK